MTTNPNQKTIAVQKEESNKEHKYAIFNLDALNTAMIDLKGETFKLWCYLNKNQNGYTFALSRIDAVKWGIGSKSSYDRAVKELITKGYLVETSPNHYDFYEMYQEEYRQDDEIVITVNKI